MDDGSTIYYKDWRSGRPIVPYADAGLLRNSTLKIYKGFPHCMPTTEADTINAGLFAFLKDIQGGSVVPGLPSLSEFPQRLGNSIPTE